MDEVREVGVVAYLVASLLASGFVAAAVAYFVAPKAAKLQADAAVKAAREQAIETERLKLRHEIARERLRAARESIERIWAAAREDLFFTRRSSALCMEAVVACSLVPSAADRKHMKAATDRLFDCMATARMRYNEFAKAKTPEERDQRVMRHSGAQVAGWQALLLVGQTADWAAARRLEALDAEHPPEEPDTDPKLTASIGELLAMDLRAMDLRGH